jgi:cytochrome P450
MRTLEKLSKGSGLSTTFPFLVKYAKYIPWKALKETQAFRREIVVSAERSLKHHLRIVETDGERARPTLFSKFYKAKGDESISFEEIRANAISYIVAGSDTTANTLTYLIWQVCKHPEIKTKLSEELKTLPASFDDADLKGLAYLRQVIEEVLRLYPAVPAGLPRVMPNNGANLMGHWIPGGTTTSIQAYSLQRNPDVFSNPLEFDPSRWANPTTAMKSSFVAFGGGSRGMLFLIAL